MICMLRCKYESCHIPERSTTAERNVDRRDANSALARVTRTDPALCSVIDISEYIFLHFLLSFVKLRD